MSDAALVFVGALLLLLTFSTAAALFDSPLAGILAVATVVVAGIATAYVGKEMVP